jgi:hypothetical protein
MVLVRPSLVIGCLLFALAIVACHSLESYTILDVVEIPHTGKAVVLSEERNFSSLCYLVNVVQYDSTIPVADLASRINPSASVIGICSPQEFQDKHIKSDGTCYYLNSDVKLKSEGGVDRIRSNWGEDSSSLRLCFYVVWKGKKFTTTE